MKPDAPAVSGLPRGILMLEGAALLAVCILAYAKLGFSWWLFAALILAPDIGMIGYLRGPKLGAHFYNALHFTPVPIALGVYGYAAAWPLGMALAAIWLAHIGLDRMLGYGLKYHSSFADTHLGRIGKS
jgi:hypothetical protein